MKTKHIFSVVIIFLFFSCKKEEVQLHMSGDTQKAIASIVAEEFDAMLQNYPLYPGGITMQVHKGKYQYFVNYRNDGNSSPDVHFRAASNTKTFTATAILMLHQEGKLNISHTLTEIIPQTGMSYLPDSQEYNIPFKSEITILDLLRHRAGVFDVTNDAVPDTIAADLPYKGELYLEYIMSSNPNHSFTTEELIQVVAQTGLYYFEPGQDYHYSNTGYSILAKIIERVSGLTYQEFMHQNIVLPMGLDHTSFPYLGSDVKMPEPFIPGYILYNGEIFDVTESNVSGNIAEGNVVTTTSDLSVFLRKTLRGEGVLSPNIVNNIMMNVLPASNNSSNAYGCGLSFSKNLGFGHTGAHEGYLSLMVYDPADDITIVMVTNTWNLTDGLDSLFQQLNGLMLDIAYRTKYLLKDQEL